MVLLLQLLGGLGIVPSNFLPTLVAWEAPSEGFLYLGLEEDVPMQLQLEVWEPPLHAAVFVPCGDQCEEQMPEEYQQEVLRWGHPLLASAM